MLNFRLWLLKKLIGKTLSVIANVQLAPGSVFRAKDGLFYRVTFNEPTLAGVKDPSIFSALPTSTFVIDSCLFYGPEAWSTSTTTTTRSTTTLPHTSTTTTLTPKSRK